jgi:hypothetical protein
MHFPKPAMFYRGLVIKLKRPFNFTRKAVILPMKTIYNYYPTISPLDTKVVKLKIEPFYIF